MPVKMNPISWLLAAVLLLVVPPHLTASQTLAAVPLPAAQKGDPARSEVPVYGYRIVRTYPHDPRAFTQGLLFSKGVFYEGTGLPGRSSLRRVKPESGQVLNIHHLPGKYFGEGIALCGNRLFQLTYRSHIGFIYDLDFRQTGQFHYPTEGWGLTCDGKSLIMSDGTAVLRWLDPITLRPVKEITVSDRGRPVTRLNELEYVRGEIFANIWETDLIARISPETGRVTGWIDLLGLAEQFDPKMPIDVMNGIAYDERGDRLFVTGKFWPKIFELKLIRKQKSDLQECPMP